MNITPKVGYKLTKDISKLIITFKVNTLYVVQNTVYLTLKDSSYLEYLKKIEGIK